MEASSRSFVLFFSTLILIGYDRACSPPNPGKRRVRSYSFPSTRDDSSPACYRSPTMPNDFDHRALNLQDKKPIVYTALSKKYFYMRLLIVKFVLQAGSVPINPFMSFDYYLADTVDRDIIRNANNNLVDLADEVWVFGSISNGVMVEIKQIKAKGRPVRYFAVVDDKDFKEISKDEVTFEDGMEAFRGVL